jgi:hypothetical protein
MPVLFCNRHLILLDYVFYRKLGRCKYISWVRTDGPHSLTLESSRIYQRYLTFNRFYSSKETTIYYCYASRKTAAASPLRLETINDSSIFPRLISTTHRCSCLIMLHILLITTLFLSCARHKKDIKRFV